MKSKYTPLFAFFLFSTIVIAQSDFRPGYVITNPGDTVFGEIDYRGDLLMGKLCKFKDADGEIIAYQPTDLQAFRFINSKYFVSRDVDGESVFLEYLVNGIVSIYYLRDEEGDHFFIDKEGEVMKEIPYKEENFMGNHNRVEYHSQNRKHVGLLTYYMQDAPELRSRINNLSKPGYRVLVNLAEDYHYAVCDDAQCIIYEKDLPWISLAFEANAGPLYNYVLEEAGMAVGLNVYLWAPRTNENLYFKTGFMQVLSFDGGAEKSFYQIPLSLEYYFMESNRFKPKFSVGSSLLTFAIDLSLGVGLNYYINDNMCITSGVVNHLTSPIVLLFGADNFGFIYSAFNVGFRVDL